MFYQLEAQIQFSSTLPPRQESLPQATRHDKNKQKEYRIIKVYGETRVQNKVLR